MVEGGDIDLRQRVAAFGQRFEQAHGGFVVFFLVGGGGGIKGGLPALGGGRGVGAVGKQGGQQQGGRADVHGHSLFGRMVGDVFQAA